MRIVPGPRGPGNPLNPLRGRDRSLQLFSVNQEFPVSASHKLALITSLPFVHTARRYYRLDVLVRILDWTAEGLRFRCRSGRSPNLERLEEVKVVTRFSVGEPAEGSLTNLLEVLSLSKELNRTWDSSLAFACLEFRVLACLPWTRLTPCPARRDSRLSGSLVARVGVPWCGRTT